MRRILLASWIAMLLWLGWTVTSAHSEPKPAALPTTTTTTSSTTTTTLPPTTTTTTAPPDTPTVSAAGPVAVPRNSYAAEPIKVIGRIEIPKLGLDTTLGEGVTLHNIDRNPSHWPGTALPGQPGNVVVMGHRVTHTRPFRHIDDLRPGDEVFFTVGGVRWRYIMAGSQVVRPSQTEIVRQTPDATGTLFACHPPGSARYRYVVHLKLAQP
jgi:sortase A